MNFEKFNSGSAFSSLEIKLEEIEKSKTCEQFFEEGKTARVVAVMFSEKGKFGKSAFLVCAEDDDTLFTMWLPKNQLETCEKMVSDTEAVEGILSGACGVKPRKYEDKKYGRGECYTVEWCNI